jgi:hypothetical protein
MVLATRASSSASPKRVRRAPILPDFELEQLPRSAIRKKPRPKVPREKKKKTATKKVVEIDEEEEKEELDAVMRGLVSDFDAAAQSEKGDPLRPVELFDTDGMGMTMPQFDPDLEPRTVGPWTPAEDAVLMSAVQENGAKHWSTIAKRLPGRIGKQCRERWHNHLNPGITKCHWTHEEDMTIQMGVIELGHKWSEIAQRLPGRTDNAVKNRYNTRIRKMGGPTVLKKAEPRISDEDFMHELMRRNVLAEEAKAPGRFSPNQIESLAAGNTGIVDTPGCHWSKHEHAQLENAIPLGAPLHEIDWAAVSRAVPARNAQSCRRHWLKYLRGDWKPLPFQAREPEPEPVLAPWTDADPTEGVDVEAMVESMTTQEPLLAEYVNHPDLELLAIETYSEGSCDATWSSSSVLVVGKPGLSFRFDTPGTTAPPVAPPENKGSGIDSEPQLETAALAKWMKQKHLEDEQASKERMEKHREMWNAMVEKTREAKKKKNDQTTTTTLPLKKMNTYFHAVKPQVPPSQASLKEQPWLRALDALAPAAPPLVAFAVPVQA